MSNVMQLELYRAISYVRDDALDPFTLTDVEGELLFCFELDLAEGAADCFSRPVFAGFELYDGEIHEEVEIPKGDYLFAQERRLLSKNEIINMKAEIQQFAATGGYELDNKLYLRYLFEDGKIVTQLFSALGGSSPC
jgi:hypothetical protein